MPPVKSSFLELLASFRPAFRGPVYRNFIVLAVGAVLNHGRQTVCQVLRVFPWPVEKSWSCFHHFFSSAKWSPLALSKILCSLILDRIPEHHPVFLIIDDTLIRRWGKKVFRISVHRDPVRSASGTKTVYARGHQWLVVSIRFSISKRSQCWALPVFVFHEIAKKVIEQENKALSRANKSPGQQPDQSGKAKKQPVKAKSRYRSPTQLIILGLHLLRRWFPERCFIVLADGTLNTHELHRYVDCDDHLDVIGHTRMDTVLHDDPPPRRKGQRGRPRKIGDRLPSPGQAAQQQNADWVKADCLWYGHTTKELLLLSGTGCWYRSGESVPRIRWVVVRDPEKKNKDIVLSTSCLDMTPDQIVSAYVWRWSIETMFEESRRHLHIETTENWSKQSIQRTVPLLFGLFSMIVLWYSQQPNQHPVSQVAWYQKTEPSFSDALSALRVELWMQAIFPESKHPRGFLKKNKEILKFIIHKAA